MEPPKPPEAQAEDLRKFLAPHLESFNWAVTAGLMKLPEWILPAEVKRDEAPEILSLSVSDLSISPPHDTRGEPILPWQCRLGGTTYGGSLEIKFRANFDNKLSKTISVYVKSIPIMVNSCLCHLNKMTPAEKVAVMEEEAESGGYFIAAGYEKLLRLIILNRQNYVFAIDRASFTTRGNNYSSLATSFRSMAPDCSSVTTNLHYLTTGNMMVLFPIQ